MRKFTPDEDQFLKDHYLCLPSSDIGRLLDRSGTTIRQRYKLLDLLVPKKIKNRFVAVAGFKKGSTPHNKGKEQSKWMSEDGMKRLHASQYQKGNKPWHTHKPFEVVKWEKSGRQYLIIYLDINNRMPLQRYIWEQVHGPIPKAHKIIFKDRNTLNCNLDNLEMVSNAELLTRNSAHRFGPEIFKIIQLRGALNRQINKRLKQLSNEK
jgi:hypothetical protein